MVTEILEVLSAAAQKLFGAQVEIELTRPDEQFGDYSTNLALQLAKQLGAPPREVAEKLVSYMKKHMSDSVQELSVAGPGFINIRLSDQALLATTQQRPGKSQKARKVVVEYSDPNPFKVLHIGHLYTSVVGDAIANLLEQAGAEVIRVNFGGDVGLHVGKTMYVILQRLGGEKPEELERVAEGDRAQWLADCYVEGTRLYDDNPASQAAIVELNKRIYELQAARDHESALAQIYWTCRQWSYDHFDQFYQRIGSHFDKYYPESEVAELGLATVKEHIGDVFEKSEGAIVFKGEAYGLHTSVFITSKGLPTYEAKDVGLVMSKWRDYKFDRSIVITANEQEQYMAVVLKAIEQFNPELVAISSHLTHGIVKLSGGAKMSSRKGNILTATKLLEVATDAYRKVHDKDDEAVVLGSVKYAFLKYRLGGDIIYDPAESVSLEGNSGPYIQYALARANSILSKASTSSRQKSPGNPLTSGERRLLKAMSEYSEVVDRAVSELKPHHICTYLYELAQAFNSFYEDNRVIGDPNEAWRLQLLEWYAEILSSGLKLLGIPTPEQI